MPAKKTATNAAEFRLASFLPFRLATVTESIYRIYASKYAEAFDMTISEIRAVFALAEHGTLSPTAMGQHTAMDKVKVSRATQSLVAKGMVNQRPDPYDGRGRLLRLTRKGVGTHARIVPLATRLESRLFSDLTPSDLAALERILTKIITRTETISRGNPD
jgi:DNA-binding MarR family transcriptional regulator